MAVLQSEPERLPPSDLPVRLAPDALLNESARVVAGGSPFRIVKLTRTGQATLARWRTGDRVGEDDAVRGLARQLLDSGLLYPDPDLPADLGNLSVIVPVRNSVVALHRCLRSMRENGGPSLELIVVDDASDDAEAIAEVAAKFDAALLRLDQPRNAAAARNQGIAVAGRPLIAFVDADVVIEPGALQRLAAQFSDETVAGVAPRIRGLSERGVIGRYEARHSSLDMGTSPAVVALHSAVSYLPSATLLVRRSALDTVGRFDEKLEIGEDVDLVWRLLAAGHKLIYDPSANVLHDHRLELKPFLQRRWEYAGSIGLLSAKHPDVLYAFRTDPVLAAALGFMALGRVRPALVAAAGRAMLLGYVLGGTTGSTPSLALEVSRRMVVGTMRGAGHAVRRSWSPCLLGHRRGRRLLIAAFVIRMLEPDGPRSPSEIGVGMVEDLVAALATTTSCIRHRTARPLLVDLSAVQALWAKPPRRNS